MPGWRNRWVCVFLGVGLVIIPDSSPRAQIVEIIREIPKVYRWARAIRDAIDRHDQIQWTITTTDNLEELLDSSSKILHELAQLKGEIGIVLDEKLSLSFERDLKVDIQSYEVHRSDPEGLKSIQERMEQHIPKLEMYGPAAYQTDFAAILVTRAIFKYRHVDPEIQKRFFKHRVDTYTNWLEEHEGYPAAILKQEVAASKAAKNEASNISSDGSKEVKWMCWKGTLLIAGNLEKGYDVKFGGYKSNCGIHWLQFEQIFAQERVKTNNELKAQSEAYHQHAEKAKVMELIIAQITAYRNSLQPAAKSGGELGPLASMD